jgi:hypothetical protein
MAKTKKRAGKKNFKKVAPYPYSVSRISEKDTLFPEKLAKAKEMLRDLERN